MLTVLFPFVIVGNSMNETTEKRRLSLENLPDLLTVREVAELLRGSPLTIKRLI